MPDMWLKERLGMVYEKRNRSNDKSDVASACYFFICFVWTNVVRKIDGAMISSINKQAHSLVNQLLRQGGNYGKDIYDSMYEGRLCKDGHNL